MRMEHLPPHPHGLPDETRSDAHGHADGHGSGHSHVHHPHRSRSWIAEIVFTAFLLSIIALTVKAVAGTLAFVLLGSVIFVIAVFHRLFPGSHFFTISLVNFIGIYACLFMVIVESNFSTISPREQAIGFILPLIAFLMGATFRGKQIRSIVVSRRPRRETPFGEIFLWLLPMAGMVILTFALPGRQWGGGSSLHFMISMSVVALIVVFVSRDIAIFLLDVGLLFEGFFQQAARLVLPAFAFLTLYSLLVILFAGLYSIIERFSRGPDFIVGGIARPLTFAESLYFSVVTLSTVGYGDIQPHSGLARFTAAVEIVMGVLLLLFGFSAIIRHTPSNNRRPPEDL
ncbi:Potassium channel domain-containing protein [Azospirillaceae bacterium]